MSNEKREQSYESPWGVTQTVEQYDQIHERWITNLITDLPEGVPTETMKNGDVWPLTFGDIDNRGRAVHGRKALRCLQCGGCARFVPLEGTIGMDWGACTHPESQYDKRVVFEHWSCKYFDDGGDRGE